jgi:hypothetical protein
LESDKLIFKKIHSQKNENLEEIACIVILHNQTGKGRKKKDKRKFPIGVRNELSSQKFSSAAFTAVPTVLFNCIQKRGQRLFSTASKTTPTILYKLRSQRRQQYSTTEVKTVSTSLFSCVHNGVNGLLQLR